MIFERNRRRPFQPAACTIRHQFDEFDPIVKAPDATDIVYVGEFRHIKGADLLIDAVARLRADGKPVTLTLAGDGEELQALKATNGVNKTQI